MSQHFQGPFWPSVLTFLRALAKFWGQVAQSLPYFDPGDIPSIAVAEDQCFLMQSFSVDMVGLLFKCQIVKDG